MMLKIEADTGKLDASLKRADDGVRKLEASVKIGDRTMRANITTEEQAAKGLDKFSEAARKAEAAEKNRMAVMAKGWNDTARRAAIEAEEANFKRQMKRMAEMQRMTEEQGSAWKRGMSSALNFAGSLTGIGTAAGAVALAISSLREEHQRLLEKANASDAGAKGLKEFIALQAPGDAGREHVKQAVLKGAAAGVNAEAVGAIAQPIQSVVDANGDGVLDAEEKKKFDEDFGAALTLQKQGIKPEDAASVITANRTRGIGGSVAADKLIAAADKSVGGPADFARAGAAINQFENTDTGLAVATALTAEGTPLEQLPTLVRGAALTLGSANDDSEFSKKFGLAGLSEEEKIAKLREEGKRRGKGATEEERIADFSRSFKSKEGGSLDEEKARAMGLLVRQGGIFDSTLEAVRAAEGSGLAEQKAAALAADPLAGSAMRSDAAAALQQADAMYGRESDAAREKKARLQEKGAWLTREGGEAGVDPATGQAIGFTDNPYKWFEGRQQAQSKRIAAGEKANISTWFGWDEKGGSTGSAGDSAQASLDALTKALQENTDATKANSSSTKKSTPVGGAASNAEEKY